MNVFLCVAENIFIFNNYCHYFNTSLIFTHIMACSYLLFIDKVIKVKQYAL